MSSSRSLRRQLVVGRRSGISAGIIWQFGIYFGQEKSKKKHYFSHMRPRLKAPSFNFALEKLAEGQSLGRKSCSVGHCLPAVKPTPPQMTAAARRTDYSVFVARSRRKITYFCALLCNCRTCTGAYAWKGSSCVGPPDSYFKRELDTFRSRIR